MSRRIAAGARVARAARPLPLAALVLAAGCAGVAPTADRQPDVIRRILPSAVRLHVEREGGVRRTASGVVVAADPAARRSWIVTARHFLEPPARQEVSVSLPGVRQRLPASIAGLSPTADLAIVAVEGPALPAVRLRDQAELGGAVLVVAFPWGRRLTVVSGIVSQIGSEEGQVATEGPARMVDASVSYGSSGGGVFDAATGELIAVVEGYRTARVAVPGERERTMGVPVPGETHVIPAEAIRRLLRASGLPAE